ncbi:formyltransferase family protein [Alphaproteobacteria bacterium]|nr:formyltransferase family protein [Alphaproteobacteria bacterium]
MTKINLFIAGYKGYETFKKLLNNKNKIDKVLSYKINKNFKYFNKIKKMCKTNNIHFKLLRSTDLTNSKEYNSKNLSFFIGWQFKAPIKKNFYIFHDSILPFFSGFSPTSTSLIKKKRYLGVTLFIPNKEIDTGKIIYQEKIPIQYPIKIKEAYKHITTSITKIINLKILNKNLNFPKKNYKKNKKRSFSIWRDDKDYFINWSQSAADVLNFINATGYPYDYAKTIYNNKIIKIIDAEIGENLTFEDIHPGKIFRIVKKEPHILTLSNLLIIKVAKYTNNQKVIFNNIRTRLG